MVESLSTIGLGEHERWRNANVKHTQLWQLFLENTLYFIYTATCLSSCLFLIAHVLNRLLFYSFRSSNNQPRQSPQPMSLSIYYSMSHHFPNKVGDKAHPSSPKLCPVGGVPVTTVFSGHPRVEQKSLHMLCTNFVLSVTGGPCTIGMSNRFKWEAWEQTWWITWQSAL